METIVYSGNDRNIIKMKRPQGIGTAGRPLHETTAEVLFSYELENHIGIAFGIDKVVAGIPI